MENTFKSNLYKLLRKDARLWNEETKEFNETLLKDLVDKLDERLIELLLSDKEVQKKFFIKVKDVHVLKQNELKFFIDENKLDNSYTQYQNKIGIRVGNKLLSERNEVVLDWPFKDCVLEGGMTKEDQKRNEIFFNELLAKDEIDRLEDPKALVNWKRFTAKGEEKVKRLKRDNVGKIRENLIIKGNNLLALHTIKNQFHGQVKLIYIDPPYNTGNDSFGYNDNFNHSTWLTFMKNRLEIARDLLKKEGVIYVSIDENEIGYTQILMDDIFGRENRSGIITIKRGSLTGHKAINPGVVNLTEYLISYCKNKAYWKPKRLFKKRERNVRYDSFILNRKQPVSKWQFCSLLDAFSDYKKISKKELKKKLGSDFEFEIFEFIKANADGVIQFAYPDFDKVSKDVQVIIRQSQDNPDKVFYVKRENEPDIYLLNGQRLLFYSDRLIEIDGEVVTAEPLSDLWDDVLPNDLHNEGGVKLKKGKKPEKLISRIIELDTEPDDIFLDFHLGSGTSVAVAHKMGRQYIGIEQLDYGDNDALIRLQNVIAGEKSGISKSVNWRGGGEFIYTELAKWNEEAKEKILKAKSLSELEKLFDELYERYFLNYNIKTKEFREKIIKEKEFGELSLDEQKKLFVEMLDMNQMYVNFSERVDSKYGLAKEDIALSEEFYSSKK